MKHLLLIMLSILFFACSDSYESEAEMMTFLKDPKNEYIQFKRTNGVDISFMYRPTDLLFLQEMDDLENLSVLDALRDKYDNYLYFNLSMSKDGEELLSIVPKDRNQFGAMVNELSFGMRDKIHLYNTSRDTIEMVDYVYPRMFGYSKSTSMLLIYPRDERTMDSDFITLEIQDLGLNTGALKFRIDKTKIKSEPSLAFDKMKD